LSVQMARMVWLAAILTLQAGCNPATAQRFTEFPLPIAKSRPAYIAAGSDGALWFTELGSNRIGRITTTGAITEYPVPTPKSEPYSIAAGPDGNMWFVEFSGNKIGRISPLGEIIEFEIPTPDSQPVAITAGPDHAMWFAELRTGRIGRITPTGTITEFAAKSPATVRRSRGLTIGPDGNLWSTLEAPPSSSDPVNMIARITPVGSITEFPVPTVNCSLASGILAGPDGALWFSEEIGNKIGRITTDGTITEFPLPNPNSLPRHFTIGTDGALFFTERADRIGRIAMDGTISEFEVPTVNASPYGIATARDGSIWFTEQGANKIAKLTWTAASERPAAIDQRRSARALRSLYRSSDGPLANPKQQTGHE
jgi:streptogramin lyase